MRGKILSLLSFFLPDYILSISNSICSESKLGYVDTLEGCRKAVPFIQRLYPDIPTEIIRYTKEDYPKGCYAYTKKVCEQPKGCRIYLDNGTQLNRNNSYYSIYFNNHAFGEAHRDNRQVCITETNGNPLVMTK